jgi:hypothetical protein
MKSMIRKFMMLISIGISVQSFSPNPGGEGFEIFLNNKVVVQRFGNQINTVNNLQLNPAAVNDKLTIKYHHCGRVGKNRTVTIKDGENNVLKVFRYADANSPVAEMTLPVKDILALKKRNGICKLFYASTELPNGRMLATLHLGNNVVQL